MNRLSRWLFLSFLSTQLLVGCKSNSNDSSDPAPSNKDPACTSQTVANCTANANCAVNGSQCAGTSSYCGTFNNSNCPTSSCLWNATANSCVPAGTVIASVPPTTTTAQCSTQPQTSCNTTSGCSWTGTACIALTNPPSCSSYNSSICPTITGCSYNGTACVASTTTIPPTTNACTNYSTQPACIAVAGCLWNGNSCAASSGCGSFTTSASCPSQACNWSGGSCVDIAVNTCPSYTSAATCPAALSCTWNGNACVSSTTANNSTCAQYTANPYSCNMASGCQFMNGTCLASQCKNLSAFACTFASGCSYYVLTASGCFPKL